MSENTNEDLYSIKYTFKSIDGGVFKYSVDIDNSTLLQVFEPTHKPAWTELEFNQCDNCPYTTKEMSHCPVALSLADLLEEYSNSLSYADCLIVIETPDRNYNRQTEVQNGIYSLMGLVMATSGCSKTNALRTMARFHLPFSTLEETLIRSLGFYLVKQYFSFKEGKVSSFDLTDLNNIYDDINKVNQGILARIKTVSKKDANKNAIVVLDAFASMLNFAIDEDFTDIEKWFKFD